MKFDKNQYEISEHFVGAIINGDYSGLEDAEERQLNDWLKAVAKHNEHWDYDDSGSDFARCEITGLLSPCLTANQWFPKAVGKVSL